MKNILWAFGVLFASLIGFAVGKNADPQGYYPVVITHVHNVKDNVGCTNAILKFNRQIPNDDGLIVVDLQNGDKIKINVWRVKENLHKSLVLETQWNSRQIGIQAADLKGCTARFYSANFPPELQK